MPLGRLALGPLGPVPDQAHRVHPHVGQQLVAVALGGRLRGELVRRPVIEDLGHAIQIIRLGHRLVDDVGPLPQTSLGDLAQFVDLGDRTEVAEQQEAIGSLPDPLDAGHPGFDVDVRRRRGGTQDPHVRQMDPHGVSGEDRAAARVLEGDVMGGMARGVEHLQGPAAQVDLVPVDDGAQALRRHGVHGAEERPEPLLAVDPARAGHQLGRVCQMRGAPLLDPYRGPGEVAGQRADPARMVEVDVGEHDVGQVLRPEVELGQAGQHRVDRGGGPGLDQRGLVPVQQVAGGHRGSPTHPGVDARDAVRGGVGRGSDARPGFAHGAGV